MLGSSWARQMGQNVLPPLALSMLCFLSVPPDPLAVTVTFPLQRPSFALTCLPMLPFYPAQAEGRLFSDHPPAFTICVAPRTSIVFGCHPYRVSLLFTISLIKSVRSLQETSCLERRFSDRDPEKQHSYNHLRRLLSEHQQHQKLERSTV